MTRAVVLSAVRTPIGRYGGGLAAVRPDDLAALAIAEAVARAGVPQFVRILPIDLPTAMSARSRGQMVDAEELMLATAPAATRSRGALRAGGPNPAINDLAGRVRSTLAFFAGRPGSSPVSLVLLAGAGVAVDGALPALTSAIDRPVRVITASDIVTTRATPPAGDLGLNLVSTIGIALGEAR